MPEVTLEWANGGEPFELKPVPINGQREIQELAMRYATAETARQNIATLTLHAYLLMAKRVLDLKGVEAAKDAWDHTLVTNDMMRPEFRWDLDDFEVTLKSYLEKHTFRAFAVDNEEDAQKALREKMAEANEEFEKHKQDVLDFNLDYTLIEIYWILRAAGVKRVGDATLTFDKAQKDADMEVIGEYASQADFVAIRTALKPQKKAPLDMKELDLVDGEEMRGKFETESETSTESKPASPPSSEATGGPEMKSATSAT